MFGRRRGEDEGAEEDDEDDEADEGEADDIAAGALVRAGRRAAQSVVPVFSTEQ